MQKRCRYKIFLVLKVSSNDFDMAKVPLPNNIPHMPYGGFPSTSYQPPPPPSYLMQSSSSVIPPPLPTHSSVHQKPPLPPGPMYQNIPQMPSSRYPPSGNQFYQPPPTNNYSHKPGRSSASNLYQQSYHQ